MTKKLGVCACVCVSVWECVYVVCVLCVGMLRVSLCVYMVYVCLCVYACTRLLCVSLYVCLCV